MDERRIANQEANIFVREGVNKHRPTKIAPEKILSPLDDGTREAIIAKQDNLLSKIESFCGKPYFTAPGFILFNNDSVEIMQQLRDTEERVDLCITSPPYNIGKEYEHIIDVNKYVVWCKEWLEKIYEVTSANGSFWLNLGYFEVPEKGLCVPIPYLLWDKSQFYLLQEVVWQYGAGVSTKKRLSPRNEKWLFYVKDKENYIFNLDAIRDPNVKYPNQKKNGKFRCNPLGKNPSDVWEFPKVTTGSKRSSKERTGHPAQFPLKIIERIVLASSNETDVVLDPFAGSCSTGIASMGLGRIYIGVEINQEYCDLSIERYKAFEQRRKDYSKQLTLF
ncbi:MAG TPA: site-specific DNA-methyltransferase [Saccharofermentans sp.]|nr:site-specific DNA-methyltransferase [Saccharofermentans sp.]